jgi:SPOR domain
MRLLFENVCVIIRKNQIKVMEEEKYQKELFKFEQPKRSFSRFAEMLPKADFEGRVSITISLEKMVFIAIGLMMVFVIVYAMGVESGKSRGNAPAVQAGKPSEQLSNAPGAQVRPAAIPARNILNTAPIVPVVKPSKPYTILAGSFAKLDNAQRSAAMLTKQGFNASVTYFQSYYRVSVGSYSDKTSADAQRDLVKVRRINKDAMFKLK